MSSSLADILKSNLSEESVADALELAQRLLVQSVFGSLDRQSEICPGPTDSDHTRITRLLDVLELAALDGILEPGEGSPGDLSATTEMCSRCFTLMRALPMPDKDLPLYKHLLRLTCFAVLGDRTADIRRWLRENPWDDNLIGNHPEGSWDRVVFLNVASAFLGAVRKQGFSDLERVARSIQRLRELQGEFEGSYLQDHSDHPQAAALELVSLYHLAKAVEDLGTYFGQGDPGPQEILGILQFHFDRALEAAAGARLPEWEVLLHWLYHASVVLARDAIWWQLRSYNSLMSKFKKVLRDAHIFELLPPQREAVQDVMNISNRSVVIEMPTSSGKTLLAQFRILQAKNSFPESWVAYLVPTRALVNQISVKLRRNLSPLGLRVETGSAALDVNVFEENLLGQHEEFDVLVTTPEKLDLLIRKGTINSDIKPLSLVVLDEAHNLSDSEGSRGLRFELLLSTLNRTYPDVQFLLLSPFIPNASELAAWLDSDRYAAVRPKLAANWLPNDRMVAIGKVCGRARDWHVSLEPIHTSSPTIYFDEEIVLRQSELPVDEPASSVYGSKSAISASIAKLISGRGTTVVIAYSPPNAWDIARTLGRNMPVKNSHADEVNLVIRFLADEFGDEFELIELLKRGIGVHHGGLSPEARYLLEWLTEEGHLDVLVATSTLAQGVNFPITSLIFADHQKYVPFKGRVDLGPDEFWNIAGRAGRLFQDTLGLVVFPVRRPPDKYKDELTVVRFVNRNVKSIVSSLESMIEEVLQKGWELNLSRLVRNDRRWSSLVQYLSHAYRQIEDHDRFLAETETVLRGTLGYQQLVQTKPMLGRALLAAAREYANRLRSYGKSTLMLVDTTGFSPETIRDLLIDKRDIALSPESWRASSLFGQSNNLEVLLGRALSIHEVDLSSPKGKAERFLSNMIRDWVKGEPFIGWPANTSSRQRMIQQH